MIYVWAAVAIAALFLVWQIVRWINLPATIEERRKAQESRSKAWADWRATRPRIFPIAGPKTEQPVKPDKPNENLIEIEVPPVKKPRDGLLARIWRRRLNRGL